MEIAKGDQSVELNDELQSCIAAVREIESFDETKKTAFQSLLSTTIEKLENLTRQVSLLGMFSKNEDIDEVSTSSIRFLLLPALLGYLTEKLASRERKEVLETAEIYFKDFLIRLKSYNVISTKLWWIDEDKLDESNASGVDSVQSSSNANPNYVREEKIRQYKLQQELKSKYDNFQKNVNVDTADDETLRQFYLTELKVWVATAESLLLNIEKEKPLAERMSLVKSGEIKEPDHSRIRPNQPPLKPIIITKTAMEKKVFGLGYPSVPTMSLEEFFEQKRQEGQIQVIDPHNDKGQAATVEDENIAKELAAEGDDTDLIRSQREYDEYKDEHRRGWGSVHNKG